MERTKSRKNKKWYEVKEKYTVEEAPGVGPSISRNPMCSIEDMVEQNDNNLDGVINNVKVEPVVNTSEIALEDKKSVLEKLKEQNRQMSQSVSASEKKQVSGCCFERGTM